MVLLINSNNEGSSEVDRVVYLKPGDFGEETLINVEKGCRIVFKLSSSLFGSNVLKLYINYSCVDGRLQFVRNKYHQLAFKNEPHFNEESCASCIIEHAGTFHFRFTTSTDASASDGGGYITVDPDLTIFSSKQRLNLNSIAMITYLPKCLGKFEDWKSRLQVAKEGGYNFIHFPPVQSLGASNSGYSIMDQMELNRSVFGDNVTWEGIGTFTSFMQEEWGILSLCDIVLNHTANETPWLRQFPDATYNLVNSPHLIPPYLIDRTLVRVSEEIAADKLAARGIPSRINNESHLNNIREYLHEILGALRLEEFYLVDVNKYASESAEFMEPVVRHTYRRYGSSVSNNAPRWKLEQINEVTRNVIRSHITAAVENVLAGARYERIQNDGPRLEMVDSRNPLAHRYFYEVPEKITLSENDSGEEVATNPASAQFILAHNGWVMNDDPLRNFAEETSNVYLRREVIAWGDSVKLRYGSQPSDSDFLWSHMAKYVQNTAKYFHGLRLDNCHSTPIHVAEYLLDCAREVRPNIFIIAELFTNSDAKDHVFVNRLGINSLVREAQSAWDSHEQGRLLFRFGGKPVGAFENTAPPPIAKAILYDQTHDNPASITKRSMKDLLPTAALISFGACAVGSTRGYDELLPFHVDVVNESRLYGSFTTKENPGAGEVNLDSGILRARRCLNQFHSYLGREGFSETFIDQLTPDVIAATRHNPSTRQTIVLVAYTAFSESAANQYQPPFSIRAVEVEGQVTEIIFEGKLVSDSAEYEPSDEYLVGLRTKLEWREVTESKNALKSQFLKISNSDKGISKIEFENFQPGDVTAVWIKPFESTQKAVSDLGDFLTSNSLSSIISKISLVELNHILYRCKEEEGGVYSIPNFGDPVYAGLQGIASILENVAKTNDLGHPLCSNLRQGDWIMDYIVMRMVSRPVTEQLGMNVQKIFQHIRQLPRYLVPTYFEKVFRKLYAQLRHHALSTMGAVDKRELHKLLTLTSLQFVGVANGGALPAGGEDYTYMENGRPFIEYSLCAGLPHFSTGYMRNWGRDTFIALPGLLLLTGRYEEAKQHILSYASVMYRGLIPNLLNQGNCRYNCRDATWWWLYSIVKFMTIVPNGDKILNEVVRFNSKSVQLQEIMHFGIESHFSGIEFRETNAGPGIDAHMKDQGFNIKIYTDLETGFIHGGNALNCGTWMDKMGSNDFVKNRGLPATPRDGAAVEIQGLAAAVFLYLGNLKKYEYKFVQGVNGVRWSYSDWASKIQTSFEQHFFVSSTTTDPLVNQRNIYKDTVGASNKYGDFQLRPNFLVTMVVAPELFEKKNAVLALDMVKEKLVSKLGIKTLDESDLNYDGNYWNQDSNDFKTAGGFNYHQGPEWLWPLGFYLRARLMFSGVSAKSEIEKVISAQFDHINKSTWKSLPELTNRNGTVCPGSCTAQAWSCGTLLEVLQEL